MKMFLSTLTLNTLFISLVLPYSSHAFHCPLATSRVFYKDEKCTSFSFPSHRTSYSTTLCISADDKMKRRKTATFLSMNSKSKIDTITVSELDEIESQAENASESWGVATTPFLNAKDAELVKSRLESRADIGVIQVGSIPTSSSVELSSRTRFVMTNPDLELDLRETEKEYCSMLRIDNIQSAAMPQSSSKSKPWPQLFSRIGVDLRCVGDVVVEVDTDNAYIMVAPEVVRQCIRLLPKELRGTGITVSEMETGEYIPYDGMQQDMELGTLDKRALQY